MNNIRSIKKKPSKPGTVNLYVYIENNRNNIDYLAYREKGYFVGSGAIESGNKVAVQNRLKLSGMRWDVTNAQSMVALKAKIESGIWDSYVVPVVYEKMDEL